MKEQILNFLKQEVLGEKENLKKVYDTTKNLIQTGDLKSDGKHDTRGTEINYLADGQRQRLAQLDQEFQLLEGIDINTSCQSVAIGSLVDIELNNSTRKYFISSTGGGKMVQIGDDLILVISVFSPLGDAALFLEIGDEFELQLETGNRTYLIKNIV